MPAKLIKALQDFANHRKRPNLLIALDNEALSSLHAVQVRDLLQDTKYDHVDLIIHSGGGDINAAYQIAEILRRHAKKVTACIPLYAKSAATLLCVAADDIVLDELAELGPLDAQIPEVKKGSGAIEYVSALNAFKALEEVQKFSIETFDIIIQTILKRSHLGLDEVICHANEFVGVTTGPLIARLDPEKLGGYSRSLLIGVEYGRRLLSRNGEHGVDQINRMVQKLVYGYPSHNYIIDEHELKELGFKASVFPSEERGCIRRLTDHFLSPSFTREIRLTEPEKAPEKQKKQSKKIKEK